MNYSMRMLQFRSCIGISFFCFKCKSQILPQNYIIVTLYLYFEMKMKGSRKSWQVPLNVQKFEIGALIPFLAPSSSPNWWQRAPRKGSHVNKYSQRIFRKKKQMRSQTFQRLRMNVSSFGTVKSWVTINVMSLPPKKKDKFVIERFYRIQFMVPR